MPIGIVAAGIVQWNDAQRVPVQFDFLLHAENPMPDARHFQSSIAGSLLMPANRQRTRKNTKKGSSWDFSGNEYRKNNECSGIPSTHRDSLFYIHTLQKNRWTRDAASRLRRLSGRYTSHSVLRPLSSARCELLAVLSSTARRSRNIGTASGLCPRC